MSSSCPACGETDATRAFDAMNRREGIDARGTYLRCDRCGTLRLSGAPSGDALHDSYASGEIDAVEKAPASAIPRTPPPRSTLQRFAREARRVLFGRPHAWPEERIGRGRILDFGCLDGAKLADFYQLGWDIAGLDLNAQGIERARALFPTGYFHCGSLEELPAEETFDVIRTDNVLEHIPEPGPIVRSLRGRLREGGRLLAYVPSGESLSVRLFGERSSVVWVPYHLTLFSRRGLETLFRDAGFTRVRVIPFSPPDWWALTARQIVAEPGYMTREPSRAERWAERSAKLLSPLLLAFSRTPLAEEWVVEASMA